MLFVVTSPLLAEQDDRSFDVADKAAHSRLGIEAKRSQLELRSTSSVCTRSANCSRRSFDWHRSTKRGLGTQSVLLPDLGSGDKLGRSGKCRDGGGWCAALPLNYLASEHMNIHEPALTSCRKITFDTLMTLTCSGWRLTVTGR